MRFSIAREDFLTPLQLVSGAVEKRHTLPILSNVLIKVEEGSLWLTGTDLEVELIASTVLSGDVVDGEVTVPARKLFDICRSLSAEANIEFSVDGNKVLVRSGRSRYTLSTLPADDYPNLEDWEGEIEFEISQKNLRSLIEKTHFSMAQQDVRYYLNGLSLELEGDLIRSVATDGHRLALSKHILDGAAFPTNQVIIPRKGVMEILRLIGDEDSSLKIQIGSNHIRLYSTEFIFTSKLVDGRFPDYRRVLPRDGDKTILADKMLLKDALTRASILSNEKFRGIRLDLTTGELQITANNPEQEEAVEVVDVDYEGATLEIGFNVAYLIDVLGAIDDDKIKLTLADSNSSALVEAQSTDKCLYVVMPMRL